MNSLKNLKILTLCFKEVVKFGTMYLNGVKINSLAFQIIQLRSNLKSLLDKYTLKPLWKTKQIADSAWVTDKDSTRRNLHLPLQLQVKI
jgi:hypothetical protein